MKHECHTLAGAETAKHLQQRVADLIVERDAIGRVKRLAKRRALLQYRFSGG